jgi:hypothetical protein
VGRKPAESRKKMAKVAKKVQLKIVEPQFFFEVELVNAVVSEARAKALVKQYQQVFQGIKVEIKAVA